MRPCWKFFFNFGEKWKFFAPPTIDIIKLGDGKCQPSFINWYIWSDEVFNANRI